MVRGGLGEDSTDEERRLWQHPLPRSDYTFPLSGVWLLTPQLSDLIKTDEMKLPFSSLLHRAPPVPLQTWPMPVKRCIIQQIICCRYLSMSALCSICVWMVFFSEVHWERCVLMPYGYIKMTKWHACYIIGSWIIWNLFPKLATASGCHLSASQSLCCPNRKAEIKCRKLLSRGVCAVSDWLAALGIIIVLLCIDSFQLMGSKAFGDVSERYNCCCEVSARL